MICLLAAVEILSLGLFLGTWSDISEWTEICDHVMGAEALN